MSSNVISIQLGANEFLNPAEPASESAFGAEFLGWEFFSNFANRQDEVEFHHVRWPGGIPVEDGINLDGSSDGSREHVYDLTAPNYVNWDRNTGDPREGIREMLDFAVENDLSLAVVLPTARYVEMIREEGAEKGLAQARSDVREFVEKLVSGEFGELPETLKLEIGSEYYSTDVWKKYTTDENGEPYSTLPDDLVSQFGDVFAAMVSEIDDVLQDSEINPDGVDLEIAVQLGRQGSNPNPNVGDVSDNYEFIESFIDAGALDAVDALIYHRYVSSFDNIDRGIDIYSDGNKLSDTIQIWEDAAGGREFDLSVGYLSPAAQSEGNPEFNAPGLTNILQFNAMLLANGMDYGSIFALGHSSEGSLGWRSEVLLGGKLYELMAESIPGKYVVDGYQENTANVVYGTDQRVVSDDVNQYVFQGEDEVVIFLAAKDFEGDVLEYELQLNVDVVGGEVTRLWDSGETLINPSTGEEIGNQPLASDEPADFVSGADGSTVFVSFQHDYEVLRIVLDVEPIDTREITGTATGDHIDGTDLSDKIQGNDGDDVIRSANGQDSINGNEGNDRLYGGDGDDIAKGGWGNDQVVGEAGDDRLSGDWGDDDVRGGPGADTLFGGSGDDLISGGLQNDLIFSGPGSDTVNGGYGKDVVLLGDGDDVFFDTEQDGQLGNDLVEGGAGDDLIVGGGGKDTFYGNEGNNTILGGDNDDLLFATGRSDLVVGGPGNDNIFADAENTIIRVFDNGASELNPEVDEIYGFDIGSDILEIDGLAFGAGPGEVDPRSFLAEEGSIQGRDLVIRIASDQSIVLKGVVSGDYSNFSASDFFEVFTNQLDTTSASTDSPEQQPQADATDLSQQVVEETLGLSLFADTNYFESYVTTSIHAQLTGHDTSIPSYEEFPDFVTVRHQSNNEIIGQEDFFYNADQIPRDELFSGPEAEFDSVI